MPAGVLEMARKRWLCTSLPYSVFTGIIPGAWNNHHGSIYMTELGETDFLLVNLPPHYCTAYDPDPGQWEAKKGLLRTLGKCFLTLKKGLKITHFLSPGNEHINPFHSY